MHTKKIALLFLILIFLVATYNKADTPYSWLSPYTNLLYKGYQNTLWFGQQLNAMKSKMSAAHLTQKKWDAMYQKKERPESDSPITDAQLSAIKFKEALESAAQKAEKMNPKGIMARFTNNIQKFLLGASSSAYQYEGGLDEHNANAEFYRKQQPQLETAGNAIEFWTRYTTDIPQMKQELGINSFRISIAWDRVEPTRGNYDEDALKTYSKIIQTLKNNIEPIVVLHHYTIPTWFAEIDGFEKKENIDYFVEYAKKVYAALYKNVTYWSTFNAIEGYAFKGYLVGDGPPGIQNNHYLTQQVMAHMLEAHVRIYQAIKDPKKGLYNIYAQTDNKIPKPYIGIQKNLVLLDPQDKNPFYIKAGSGITAVIGEGLQNKGFFDFFTTGIFNVYVPQFTAYGPKNVYYENPDAPQSIDWIGLNIYSNMFMRLAQKQKETDEDKQTTNLNYRDYPEGIYRAVEIINNRIAKPLALPIIITENGIATDKDEQRTRFFQRTLYTIRKCIEEGYPIIGYTPWASHDNYEWPSQEQPDPFTSRRYGFFFVDFNNNLTRTLKPGAEYYRDFIAEFFKSNSNYEPTVTSRKQYNPPLRK